MPRLTRSALTESPEPTRRSSRASTHASSTSSLATPPHRGRSRGKKGAAGDGEEKPEEIEKEEQETEKAGRGRSQTRKKAEVKVAPAQTTTPKGKRGRSRTPATPADPPPAPAIEPDTPAEAPAADAPEEVLEEPKAPPKGKTRGRSRGRAAAAASSTPALEEIPTEASPPVTTPSPGRGRRGRAPKEVSPASSTTPPVKTTPRRGRGRRSDPAEAEAAAAGDTPQSKKPEAPQTEPETIPTPVVEPITPDSETADTEALPKTSEEEVAMETEPGTTTTLVSQSAPTSSTGTKRKLEDDEIDEPEAKRQNISNEATPAASKDVEMSDTSSASSTSQQKSTETKAAPTQSTAQSSEAEAAKSETEDFVVISHEDVPSADSQEVQQAVLNSNTPSTLKSQSDSAVSSRPVSTQSKTSSTPVAPTSSSTSEAEVRSVLPVVSSGSSQMTLSSVPSSHTPLVEDVSPVESSMDSNIGSYGDDKDALAPQASAADSNVCSQSAESTDRRGQEPVTGSNTNEATPQPLANSRSNHQPVSQSHVSQSEPVSSSQKTNGITSIKNKQTASPYKARVDHFEPKIAPTVEYKTKHSSDIFHRHLLSNPALSATVDPSRQFSIVTYNILADFHMRNGNYSYTEEKFLDQTYRHKLLLQELQYLNGDVVCLQEVNPEYFNSMLKPELEKMGYQGSMQKRCQDYFNEGEATLYRMTRFALEEQTGYNLKDLADREVTAGGLNDDVQTAVREYLNRADVLQITKLRCLNTGKVISIGNIHVLWDKLRCPDVQCIQIASAVKELVNKAGNDTTPFILCGDFNSYTSSPGYQLARDGYLSDANIHKLQALENLETTEGSKSLLNHLWRAFQHTASNLKSAYFTVQGQEPAVTSYTGKMHSVVDYVFYNANSLDVAATLQVVHEDVVNKTGGLPDEKFPSDHLSLKAVFNMKE